MVGAADAFRVRLRAVLDELRAALQRAEGLAALLVADIGHLSALESRLGFEASEALIAQLGDSLARAVRERDTVLRFGDARFCVLIGAIRNRGHAVLAAEKIWHLAHEAIAAAPAIRPDVRIGIALHPTHAEEPRELLHRAQLAAASARERHERLLFADEVYTEQVVERWQLTERFAAALECGEIEMYYQPKIRIMDSRLAGAEALMRWMRDDRAVATPDVFIPLAEETGLIESATWFALNAGLRNASEWPAAAALGVAVNISPAMLHHREFVEMVHRALAAWNLSGGRLTLEITEGALIADLQEATTKLRRLRDLGIRVSIDDFGTGYSSLSYFKKIPADELKIDKSFVMRMRQDPDDERIVRAIVDLARHFQLAVVAEGVEDQATLDALGAIGCDYAQGFLFSPALQQNSFLTWLAGRVPAARPHFA